MAKITSVLFFSSATMRTWGSWSPFAPALPKPKSASDDGPVSAPEELLFAKLASIFEAEVSPLPRPDLLVAPVGEDVEPIEVAVVPGAVRMAFVSELPVSGSTELTWPFENSLVSTRATSTARLFCVWFRLPRVVPAMACWPMIMQTS